MYINIYIYIYISVNIRHHNLLKRQDKQIYKNRCISSNKTSSVKIKDKIYKFIVSLKISYNFDKYPIKNSLF